MQPDGALTLQMCQQHRHPNVSVSHIVPQLSFNRKCFRLEMPPPGWIVTDVWLFLFLFKRKFWKETLMTGRWSMRHRGHQSSVLSVSRGCWSKLSHRGALDWHHFRCSRCLCAAPTEVTWVKVEPGRGTQVTSNLLFKLSDQVSFPGMFHWHCSHSTLVFDRIYMKGNEHQLLWSL